MAARCVRGVCLALVVMCLNSGGSSNYGVSAASANRRARVSGSGYGSRDKERRNEDDVVGHRNIAAGLNMLAPSALRRAEFVERLPPYGWRFESQFQGIVLPQSQTPAFIENLRGSFHIRISGLLLNTTQTVLISILDRHKILPYVELSLDLIDSRITMRYLGAISFQRVTLDNVFPKNSRWTDLHVMVTEDQFSASVDCIQEETVSAKLRQKIGVIPETANIVFGSKKHGQSGLQGVLFHATITNHSVSTLDCNAQSDFPVSDQPLDVGSGFVLSSPRDQQVLEQRIGQLEQQLAQVSLLVDNLRKENTDLKERVAHLETCECVPSCSFNGTVFKDGDMWFPEDCTQCQCVNSKSECSRRLDLQHCADPCFSSPCLNNGQCINPGTDVDSISFQCQCPSPFNGDQCQTRQNPCAWPVEPGQCGEEIVRYYYDKLSQTCQPFMFSGCGGNVNNFLNLEECTRVALTGACCYRTYRTSIEHLTRSTQQIDIKCKELHMSECKALHRQSENDTETEVISFNPGLTCAEAACQTTDVCVVGQRVYTVGQEIELGCQKCQCQPQGQISCLCEQVSTRKEIRDMTQEELVRFQKAVAKLRASEDRTWEQFRDLYMYHVMHSGGGPFFLPWQRTFLRQVEQRLQEIDCRIVLPYFDFTTDVGFFEEAVIWESFLYGGNGDGKCVEDHPFGAKDEWQPCLVRNFNTSIQLPSRMELHLALSSDDFDEMTACLETYIAYVHNFIGGDMMTSSSPYDPVHYAIHAFVDMLYWTWQQRGENKFKFPAAYGNIPMIPFNIPPWAVFDSEADVCVTYALPSKGNPCNFTSVDTVRRRPTHRSDTQPDSDVVVTNHTGMGHPFKNGYNRDGYDQEGFDFGGFDRYGFNSDGFDRYGYDKNGLDRYGNVDNTGRFNSGGFDTECLNREGLTRQGLDQYGFYQTGLDVDRCMFYFNGPFSPLQSYRIHSTLVTQPKSFLMEMTRTCPRLSPLPGNWLHLNWVPTIKDVTGLVPVHLPDMQSGPSSRFCFDTSPFLTSCHCDGPPARCQANPCRGQTCEAFPEAFCRMSFCGSCSARWIYRGKEVDCRMNRDHSDPNPCLNGGTCRRSIWVKEPSKVTCQCPPGFEGHMCQHPVQDRCVLPLARGSCDERQEKWYYNSNSGRCERFRYLGCGGNANQFASQVDCQDACVKGACCWREPRYRNQNVGLDNQGYDKYGFSEEGFNRFEEKRRMENSFPFGSQRFDSDGFDWQGFDQDGFGPEDQLNRAGYDVDGYDSDGFNLTGYSRNGEYDGIIDYDQDGYDEEGFNRAGLSCHGNDREGYDVFGVSGAYKYSCEVTTLFKCQDNAREGLDVIKFTPGKTCEEAGCGQECGCRHGNKVYGVYERFTMGCQSCVCSENGVSVCSCDNTVKRREIRDLSKDELKRYQKAVRQLLTETGHPSQWYKLASLYASHKPLAAGGPMFLPWNRQFLRHVEQAIQDIDCGLSIPYYDWTVDAGKPHKTLIWAANMMGGDGFENDCVGYHPFKPHYPPYLSPCLRRSFNSSTTLPSAVNIELALREPSYDRFRLQLEMFSNMYRQFVGGHMASDLSPYDPLYYSVMAYVDKLWTEWQIRHPEALLAFPLEKRYARLSPFKSTPDDVFESSLQMCVDYTPIAHGSACNVSSRVFYPGYNPQGYDRHGYNREGFDKDGYNVDGVDASGNADEREIYNIHGYDRDGFSRTGFDSMGLDRYGFFTDSYNLDDMDAEGYDRSGYNRYGFNRDGYTPYGYSIDGTTLGNINISGLNILDQFGYNKYGYDQEGFHRNGFDIFGFDAKGYDERRCNRYFNGPFHILVQGHISNTLSGLGITTLSKVKRICSPLQPLENHVIRQSWLNRHWQGMAMRDLYRYHNENHSFDRLYLPKETSVTTDLIWIPVAPDERLCFVTEVYTDCRLGENQMLCSDDLCYNKVCPEYPTALCRIQSCGVCQRQWYDGLTGQLLECSGCLDESRQIRREGETWAAPSDRCSTCTCRDGESRCQKVGCPPVDCQYPVQLEDQCCPSCDGCDYRGQVIMSGSDFMLEEDPCSRCRCVAGNVRCSPVECPDLGGCKSRVRPTDQCCDICLDCGDRGHGDRWNPDPCRECVCQGGQVRCTTVVCERPSCDHPSTRPGECCAQCSECLYEGVLRQNGESFSPRPCDQCLCQDGTVECNTKVCGKSACSNPIRVEGECCPVCGLDCEYEGQRHEDGSYFSPSYSPCMNCSCSNSIVRCRNVRCPPTNLPCRNPVRRPGECCPSSCPTCEHQGVEYNEGQTWPSPDSHCEVCQCRNGAVRCRPKQECTKRCSHGLMKRPECCSQCEDCLFEGRVISQGETRTIHGDVCRQCACRFGSVTCQNVRTDRECPRLDCRRTELKPDVCCPVCAACVYRGQRFEHGALVSKDECSDCTCDGGEISCTEPVCPQAKCSNPIKVQGQCCPVCDSCFYYGQEYMNGESFRSRYDACQQCTCLSGKVECVSVESSCPRVTCTHPGRRKDQCCPVCETCAYQRKTLFDGQRLIGSNPCEICVCQKGSVVCESTVCPSVECQSPIVKPGRCCPSCDGICTMDGVDYQEGQVFKRPGVDCSTCTCQNGEVTCEIEACQPLTCQHPARLPNECCPKCNFCLYERRIFRNQQRFVHPWDTCQQCSCQFGTVTCLRTQCEDLECSNPMPMPGSCCPSCPKQCEHQGLFYDDGETFVNTRNKCEDCLCRQGTTRCKARMCPRVSCANPVFDGCCQRCTDCEIDNVVIKNGETKPNPGDMCSVCSCTNGDVRCESVLCPSVSCSNPVVQGCCPVCGDCEYRGRIYGNAVIIKSDDRCRTCVCREGNVDCQTNPCPVVTCLHPTKGQCCQECRECFYKGVAYRDGQVFPDPGDGVCHDCVCSKGTVSCLPKLCPTVTCSHPTQEKCCKVCQNCLYLGVGYRDGDAFPDPMGDGCQDCVCSRGNVICQPVACPPVTCTHPVQGRCCQECRGCSYRGIGYRDGQVFPDPGGDACQDCVCNKGNVICRSEACPPVTCTHPVQGRCCQECRGCSYRGVGYRDGQVFPDPEGDACQDCVCNKGSVSCLPKVCPPLQCTHPTPGLCCNECRDCLYNGITVAEGRAIDSPDDPCEQCQCDRGSVTCYRQRCPDTGRCLHPVTRGCCQECNSCYYENTEYRNGEQFSDPASKCISCRCSNGDVTCRPKDCPQAPCSHPVQGECCLQCGGSCDYQGKIIGDGQQFMSETDKCQECRCDRGSVRCSQTDCSQFPQCSHPIEVTGECCPVCGRDCLYQGSVIQNGGGFQDNCQDCECRGGDIKCRPKTCPRVECSNPVLDGCCQMCSDCQINRKRYINGQTFPDRKDPCGQCHCKDGTVSCRRKQCPSTQCSHPTRGACCDECDDGCLFNRQTFSSGQRFADPDNGCKECVCKLGSVVCNNKRCQPVSCQDPIKDACGCPSCQACLYQGSKVKDGERFTSPSNRCQECYCRGGSVTCNKAPCGESCSHPARRDRDGCCPQCDACLYQGNIVESLRTVDSSKDPCLTCTCNRGSVTCKTKPCPPVTCLQPVKVDGDCCMSCPMCVYMGKTYLDNQRFQHPEDLCQTCSCKMGRVECESERCPATCSHPRKDVCCPKCDDCFFEDTLFANGLTFQPDACRSCMCKDGNVMCEEQTCRTLPCKATRRVEGSCCDSCQGCTFQGILYDEDASWVLPDNPCVSCSCHNGLVTCMDTQCFVPCANPITLPGQCCPVCPSCNYEGRLYSDGQDFTPNGDPCDQCHCEDGNMRCIHDTCPSVASCPSGSLRDPQPGSCCPTCDSAVSTDCTVAEIGQIRRPRSEDPCLVCECKEDFMWVCTREKCSGLACPPDLHIYSEDTCCPQCPACFDVTSAKFFNEGDSWSAEDDPCIQCACQNSEVKCDVMTCPRVTCQRTETAVILEGQCCHSCQNVPDATCEQEGVVYQPGSSWMVDECTSCECLGGSVSCQVQQCPFADCPTDEIPVSAPGQCCPVCQKRPGTCLVFGDPHYRTFDGATLHFQGMCRYIMAADCEGNTFKVEVHHDNRGARGEVSWAQNITVSVAGIQVHLLQKNKVKVDGELVELPFLFEPHVQVERTENTVLLTTQIGVKVLWDGDNYGEVIVPGSYKRRMCGLCGNFNGFAQDDLRTKAGQITNSPATFGNSWKSTSQVGEACQDARDVDPCSVSGGYRLRKMATSRCAILQDQAFSRCHRVVSPEPYFASCVYDMCVCMEDPKCLCDIVTTYARECARMGIRVEWRTQELCSFDCDSSKGFVFDECGPVCPRTCQNSHPAATNRNVTETCFKPCVPSCQCTADKVLHKGRCVSPDQCPFMPPRIAADTDDRQNRSRR